MTTGVSIVTNTGNASAPAIIQLGGHSTPVWIQTAWKQGEYAEFIQRNGCGHCCTAMIANLRGVSIDPHQEFLLCCELWGTPHECGILDPFITVSGMAKVLTHLGIKATAFGVPFGGQRAATEHIINCLKAHRLVAFISDPLRNPQNPFSTGLHYVLAVEVDAEGRILVANSSEKVVKGGVQYVDRTTVEKSLYQGGTANEKMTWGNVDDIPAGCTYVVIE